MARHLGLMGDAMSATTAGLSGTGVVRQWYRGSRVLTIKAEAFRWSTSRQEPSRRCIRSRIKGRCGVRTTSYLMRTGGFGLRTLARRDGMIWTGVVYATPRQMGAPAAKS